MKVNETLHSMLTENTGRHMLDSGGAYGRHWERNQSKTLEDFESELPVEYSHDWGYTISTFHYLNNQLELDNLSEEFNSKFESMKDWDSELYGVSKEAYKWLKNKAISPEEFVLNNFNTYNGDSSLSQVVQGTYLNMEGNGNTATHVLIQIHGGCDVRGGYTDAKLFKLTEDYLMPGDVIGTIEHEGKEYPLSNMYDGYSLRLDETGAGEELPFEITEKDRVTLDLLTY